LNNTISTIQANISFDTLQALGDSSPTGGALGQVSEVEIKLLMDSLTALGQGQSKEQEIANLKEVKRNNSNMQYLMKNEMPPEYDKRAKTETKKTTSAETTEKKPADMTDDELLKYIEGL
jgi:hypothetical protein